MQAIAAVREQIKTGEMAAFKAGIQRELERMFTSAEATLGTHNAGIIKQLDDLEAKLNDPHTKEALGAADINAQLKKLATFRKVNTDKMKEADIAQATRDVEYAESQFPEWMKDLKEGSPNSQSGAAESMQRRYDGFQQTIKDLPKTDPAVVALVGTDGEDETRGRRRVRRRDGRRSARPFETQLGYRRRRVRRLGSRNVGADLPTDRRKRRSQATSKLGIRRRPPPQPGLAASLKASPATSKRSRWPINHR
ncbi:MAG: hypothetical protein QM775_27195 [Pirellulales bacterium]